MQQLHATEHDESHPCHPSAQVAELKDSTRYERTLALLQKYDPGAHSACVDQIVAAHSLQQSGQAAIQAACRAGVCDTDPACAPLWPSLSLLQALGKLSGMARACCLVACQPRMRWIASHLHGAPPHRLTMCRPMPPVLQIMCHPARSAFPAAASRLGLGLPAAAVLPAGRRERR